MDNSGSPFRTRVCRCRAIAICIKIERLRRCSITSDHHRFGGFPGIGPSNDLGDAKACNHVGAAIIANPQSIRGRIEEIDESDHTIIVEFFFIDQRSSKTRNTKSENPTTTFIYPFVISRRFVTRIQYTTQSHISKDYKHIREIEHVCSSRDRNVNFANVSVAMNSVLHRKRKEKLNYCLFHLIPIYVRSTSDMCESRVKFDEIPRVSFATSLRKPL